MVGFLSVLVTGTGPIFVVESLLPPLVWSRILTDAVPDRTDAKNYPLQTEGTLDLVMRRGFSVWKWDFILCRTLTAPVPLGCDYCDRIVNTIRHRLRRVEFHYGSSVPIVHSPLKRASLKQVTILAVKKPPPTSCESTKARIADSVV